MATATKTTSTTKPRTSGEVFDWVHRPENRDRWFELERGKVIEMPPPGVRHGVVCGNVGWILNGFVRQRNQGYVCSNRSRTLPHAPGIGKRNQD
jgi:Uma2 family endonuclease